MKKIFVLLVFMFSVQFVFAGGPHENVMSVTGKVVDAKTNETLAGVKVHIAGTDIVAYTDFDGNFLFPTIPAGSYVLEFDYITYAAQQTVADNESHCCNLLVTLNQR